MSYSQARDTRQSRTFTNGFVLAKDVSNKHRASPALAETVVLPGSIPFLRDPRTNNNKQF
jgi:hypothetical protein